MVLKIVMKPITSKHGDNWSMKAAYEWRGTKYKVCTKWQQKGVWLVVRCRPHDVTGQTLSKHDHQWKHGLTVYCNIPQFLCQIQTKMSAKIQNVPENEINQYTSDFSYLYSVSIIEFICFMTWNAKSWLMGLWICWTLLNI